MDSPKQPHIMKASFYEIEPYHIQVYGIALTIIPMEDGVYRVQRQDKCIADVYPEITAVGIYWNSFGRISPMLAEEIGNRIYACEI